MTRCPLRPDLKMLKYTMLPDAVTQPIFYPNLLNNVTNALGHITNINNECSSTKWLPAPSHSGVIPPNFDQISILASDLYHAVPIGMIVSSVNHFRVSVRVS